MEKEKLVSIRNVQVTGKSTFIISLPKNWAKRVGITKGSKLILEVLKNGYLLIKPREKFEKLEFLQLNAWEYDNLSDLLREIVAGYLNGFNYIKINFNKEIFQWSKTIKDFSKIKFIGFEVIEESSNYIVLQSLVAHDQLPLGKVIERMGNTTLYMIIDSIEALSNLNKLLAESVIKRDDEVDRFYFYSIRQLNLAISMPDILNKIGVTSLKDLLGYRIVIKSIERIADHATRICEQILRLKSVGKNVIKQLRDFGYNVKTIFEEALKTFLSKDREFAHKLIDSVKKLQNEEEKLTRKLILENDTQASPIEIIAIKLILDSFKRIADYSSDIAEIVIEQSTGRD